MQSGGARGSAGLAGLASLTRRLQVSKLAGTGRRVIEPQGGATEQPGSQFETGWAAKRRLPGVMFLTEDSMFPVPQVERRSRHSLLRPEPWLRRL